MKQAVCLLLKVEEIDTEYGGYISVSRRNNVLEWGLPGGKVDEGETPIDAIVRETKEEIGLDLDKSLLKEVFTGVCCGDVDYITTTYSYPSITYAIADSLVVESGLEIAVLEQDDLIDTETSPFAEYNAQLFQSIKEDAAEAHVTRIENLLDTYYSAQFAYDTSNTCSSERYTHQEDAAIYAKCELLDEIRRLLLK